MKNNKGFTLVQVLVGVGLISVMSMASLSIFNNMMKQSKTSESLAEFNKMHDEVSTIIRNTDLCSAALKGVNVANGDTAVKFQLPGSNRSLEDNKQYGKNWDINSVKLSGVTSLPNFQDPTMRQALLTISAQKKAESTSMKVDEFYVFFTVDPSDNIVTCISSPDQKTVKDNCDSLGGLSTGTNCNLPPVSPVANCEKLGGKYDPTRSPACQIKSPCNQEEIFMGYVGGVAQCKTPQKIVGDGCTADQVLVAVNGSVSCIPKSKIRLPANNPPPTSPENPPYFCGKEASGTKWVPANMISPPPPPPADFATSPSAETCLQVQADTAPGGKYYCGRPFLNKGAAINAECRTAMLIMPEIATIEGEPPDASAPQPTPVSCTVFRNICRD